MSRMFESKMEDEEVKTPSMLCMNENDELLMVDVGHSHCKRSYLGYFFGLSPKWKPTYQCGDPSNRHFCDEYTPQELETLRRSRSNTVPTKLPKIYH